MLPAEFTRFSQPQLQNGKLISTHVRASSRHAPRTQRMRDVSHLPTLSGSKWARLTTVIRSTPPPSAFPMSYPASRVHPPARLTPTSGTGLP